MVVKKALNDDGGCTPPGNAGKEGLEAAPRQLYHRPYTLVAVSSILL